MTLDRRGFDGNRKDITLIMKHQRGFHESKCFNDLDKVSDVCLHRDSFHESCHSLEIDQLAIEKEISEFPEFIEDFGDFGDFSINDSSDWQIQLTQRDRIPLAEDPRVKLRAQGFNWNKAKLVRMLSSRSLNNECNDENDVDSNGSDEGEDLSTVYSVGTNYTQTTQGSEWSDMSSAKNSLKDFDKAVADELEKLSEVELAERFLKVQKKLDRRRRRKLRKSKDRDRFEKSKYLSLCSDDESSTDVPHP
jgi:hypothetical protein